jgi:hypothetical protein
MESLFDQHSNRSGPLNIMSARASNHYDKLLFLLQHHLGLDIHPWDLGPSWSTPQSCGEHLKYAQG